MKDRSDPHVAGRKVEHLRAIEADAGIERSGSGFDRVSLTHRALPELNYDEIDTRAQFLGKPLSFPMLMSSMTGGTGEEILHINRNLAGAAEATGVAMAVGSQRVMFTDPDARASFALRDFAPSAPLIANIGAVQLNMGVTAADCMDAVEILDADGLYLHLNPLQEAVQPEGDVNFSNLGAKIAEIAEAMPVPVLFKEVGCGLSVADIQLGLRSGIRHFDVAGRGGTSWSRIEYHRRNADDDDLGLVFQDWGLPTVDAVREAHTHLSTTAPDAVLIASGGIRNGIDMAKCVILGAQICGVAAPLLRAAQHSQEAVIAATRKLQREFQTAMFLLGCGSVAEMRGKTDLLRL